VGAIVLIVAEFSTISYRTIGIGACSDRVGGGVCHTTGHESHGFALLILAVVALVMAWGAVVGRSRAAAIALASIGAVVLLIAVAIDAPKLHDKRGLDTFYNGVVPHTGTAFYLELVGGVLLLLAGGLAVGRQEPGAEPAPRRRVTEEDLMMPPPEPEPEPGTEPEPAPPVEPEAVTQEEAAVPRPRQRPKPKGVRSQSARQARGKGSRQRRPPRKPGPS
jgi:hypothetical protein